LFLDTSYMASVSLIWKSLKSVLPPQGALAENISMVSILNPFPFILKLCGDTKGREFLLTVSTSHVDTSSLLQLRGSLWRESSCRESFRCLSFRCLFKFLFSLPALETIPASESLLSVGGEGWGSSESPPALRLALRSSSSNLTIGGRNIRPGMESGLSCNWDPCLLLFGSGPLLQHLSFSNWI